MYIVYEYDRSLSHIRMFKLYSQIFDLSFLSIKIIKAEDNSSMACYKIFYNIVVEKKPPPWLVDPIDTTSSLNTSKILTMAMQTILERLRLQRNRSSTRENYYTIWKIFNKFIIQLDNLPNLWEDRVYLFLAHMVNTGKKSTTLRCYLSAIKSILMDGDFELQEDQIRLRVIVRSCRLHNNKLKPSFPIKLNLLELILFEVKRLYHDQFYFCILYQTLFAIAYYGMFRIGELVQGPHVVRAKNVHLALNKNKIQFLLFTSKTHSEKDRLQKVKISDSRHDFNASQSRRSAKHFCPFQLLTNYIEMRGAYHSMEENFFVFRDHMPIKAELVRKILTYTIKQPGLDPTFYTFHSFHSGCTTNLHSWGVPIETIKSLGRWKSNSIYKYLKN